MNVHGFYRLLSCLGVQVSGVTSPESYDCPRRAVYVLKETSLYNEREHNLKVEETATERRKYSTL